MIKCINEEGNVKFFLNTVLFILIIKKGSCLFINNSSKTEIFESNFEQSKAIEVIVFEEKKGINIFFII